MDTQMVFYGKLPDAWRKQFIQMPNHSRDGYLDLWVSYDTWFSPILIEANYHDAGLPQHIVQLVDLFRNEAIAAKETVGDLCPEKYAGLKFILHGGLYKLLPSAVECDDALFGYMSSKWELKLLAMGSPYIMYTGSID